MRALKMDARLLFVKLFSLNKKHKREEKNQICFCGQTWHVSLRRLGLGTRIEKSCWDNEQNETVVICVNLWLFPLEDRFCMYRCIKMLYEKYSPSIFSHWNHHPRDDWNEVNFYVATAMNLQILAAEVYRLEKNLAKQKVHWQDSNSSEEMDVDLPEEVMDWL